MHLSSRLGDLPDSGTLAVGERVRELRAEGREVFNLSGGAPSPAAPTPLSPPLISPDENTLGNCWGDPVLREKFAARLARVHGVTRASSEMVVTIGAKQGLYFALLSILDAGDEVIVLDPCWVTYAPSITLANGKPVPIALTGSDNGLDLSAIAHAASKGARAIIINTPHNPTGRVFTKSEIDGIAEIVRDKKLWLICDESFDLFTYDKNRHLSPGTLDNIRDQTILLYSFSKSFALPSYRIGMLVGPEPVCRAVAKCSQQVISSVSLASQKIALDALEQEHEWAPRLRANYERKRDACAERLAADSRIALRSPQGAFYLFPNIEKTGFTSDALTEHLLDKAGVAVTSGSAFGAAGLGHIRINFVGELPAVLAGIDRLIEGLDLR